MTDPPTHTACMYVQYVGGGGAHDTAGVGLGFSAPSVSTNSLVYEPTIRVTVCVPRTRRRAAPRGARLRADVTPPRGRAELGVGFISDQPASASLLTESAVGLDSLELELVSEMDSGPRGGGVGRVPAARCLLCRSVGRSVVVLLDWTLAGEALARPAPTSPTERSGHVD